MMPRSQALLLSFCAGMCALCLVITACGEGTQSSQREEMELTEKNHQRLRAAVPEPQLQTSLERTQLKKRLERFNQEQKISYIYLISHGRVMAYYAIKGKVSSVNSFLTTPDQVIWAQRGTSTSYSPQVVASPDLDGSYGSNGNGVFFFTADDIYVEWNGEFLLSDRPLRMSQEPFMTEEATTTAAGE